MMNVGKKAMCQPIRQMSVMQVSTSRTAFNGLTDPSMKNGKSPICSRSTKAAMPRAVQTRTPLVMRNTVPRERELYDIA
jgi:hypothetical protein